MRKQALPTNYRGLTYRSRAEARWAIVFDKLGWQHLYEYEAYALPSGGYLPDFYLPGFNVFFEIKGTRPDERAKRKALELSETTEYPVVISSGPPNHLRKEWDEDLLIFYPERYDDGVESYEYAGGFVNRRQEEHPACSLHLGNLAHLGSNTEVNWQTAFNAAANARFGVHEH